MLDPKHLLEMSDLLSPLTSKSYNLTQNLQKLVGLSLCKDFPFLKTSVESQKNYLHSTIKLLTNPIASRVQKTWITILLLNAFAFNCLPNTLPLEIIQFLTDIYSDLNVELNEIKSAKNVRASSNSLSSKLSSSYLNLKSLLTLSSKKCLNQKSVEAEIVWAGLIDSILSYERKKLQRYSFIQSLKNQALSKGQTVQEKRQKVWKIINLIKQHTTIVQAYKKISFMSEQFKPLMVATFNSFCKDSLLLYPHIVSTIEMTAELVKQAYDKIRSQRLPKQIKQNKIEALGRDCMFVEVKNLLQELTPINETIFYLFCAKQHYNHIKLDIPKGFFLNTTNHRLDSIHSIIKEVHLTVQKQKRIKMHMSQIVGKLDQSVSKVVSKANQRNVTVCGLTKLQQLQEEKETANEEQDEMLLVKGEVKKKEFAYFQEATEEI